MPNGWTRCAPLHSFGLDSLMAIELKNQIETDLGLAVRLTAFLDGVTIEQLADQAERPREDAVAARSSRATTRGPSIRCRSASQARSWSLHQMNPLSPAYNLAGAVRVRAALDEEVLRRSLQRLVDRHASLRTTFPVVDGGPVQHVHDRAEVAFRAEDDVPDALRRLAEEARRPFDLERGPLLPGAAPDFVRSDQGADMLLALHHIISDFWSIAVLMDELSRLYAAESSGTAAALPALALHYADFARWQTENLAGPEGERLWSYWLEALRGPLPALDLPLDRPRPAVQTLRGATRALRLDAGLTRRLGALGTSQGASLYVTLLAAFRSLARIARLRRPRRRDPRHLARPSRGGTVPNSRRTRRLLRERAADPRGPFGQSDVRWMCSLWVRRGPSRTRLRIPPGISRSRCWSNAWDWCAIPAARPSLRSCSSSRRRSGSMTKGSRRSPCAATARA